MPRQSKIEVSAVNLRIDSDYVRDYEGLLNRIVGLKQGIRVYGDSYVALTFFNPTNGLGIFSKYTEIDVDGEWFDIDQFDTAEPVDVDRISIPENLKPNLSQFYFKLDTDLHVVAFEKYSQSKGLSARSVDQFFKGILNHPTMRQHYGHVEADIVRDYGRVEAMLSSPTLTEVRVVVRKPNTDDIGKDLAERIEKRLKENNANELEERLKADKKDHLSPTNRLKKLGIIAAENGEVHTKRVENGLLVTDSTTEHPLVESETLTTDDDDQRMFYRVAAKVFNKIREKRAEVGDVEEERSER